MEVIPMFSQPTKKETPAGNAAMWGGIAGAASSIVNTVIANSPKNRDANVAIAEANARAAEAAASSPAGSNGKVIGITIAVAAVVIILVFALKR